MPRGRPKTSSVLSTMLFTRVDPPTQAAFNRLAGEYGVKGAVLLRWLVQDALNGLYKPQATVRGTAGRKASRSQ